MSPGEVVAFWSEAGPERWYKKDAAFDEALRERFEAAHHAAARGECAPWAQTPEGALALCLLLDQIPRNLYRNSAHAFAADGLARSIALAAIDAGFDQAVPMPLRIFFYMPLEHAEDIALQERCCALTQACGVEEYTRYAALHRDIIARFGRFPHRNACLGRPTTEEEARFLAEGGFAG
jgi:uncharacterized protein (DUF924 family)